MEVGRGLTLLLAVAAMATIVPGRAETRAWNQAQPLCPNLRVQLKASRSIKPGDAASATFTIKNAASTAMIGVMVSIQLPEHFLSPHAAKPAGGVYTSPSQIWTEVTIPARKSLRFKVKAKHDTCQPAAATAAFNAQAYMMSNGAITCLSPARPAMATVKRGRSSAMPCPTPPPGAPYAIDQIFTGMLTGPAGRALEGTAHRTLLSSQQSTLLDCKVFCATSFNFPFYASYNNITAACGCCQDVETCGSLVYAPGTNTHQVNSE